jgi:flagellar biosynthesis protein FlhF
LPSIADVFAGQEINVQLVLSAATRQIELRQILQRYLAIGLDGLIVTKLDEAIALGAILNASLFGSVPLSYVTFGQRVPEDIADADNSQLAEDLVERVLESSHFQFREMRGNKRAG